MLAGLDSLLQLWNPGTGFAFPAAIPFLSHGRGELSLCASSPALPSLFSLLKAHEGCDLWSQGLCKVVSPFPREQARSLGCSDAAAASPASLQTSEAITSLLLPDSVGFFLHLLIRTNLAFYNCISEISSSLISLCWITQRCNCAEKKGIKMQNALPYFFLLNPFFLLLFFSFFLFFHFTRGLLLFACPPMCVSVCLHKENELGTQREWFLFLHTSQKWILKFKQKKYILTPLISSLWSIMKKADYF